jgi:hypothetical protein
MSPKQTIRIVLLVSLVAAVAANVPAVSPDLEGGKSACFLEGVWYGTIPGGAAYVATYSSNNHASGSSSMEWLAFDPTWAGAFPNAVTASDAHGVWQRCGPTTYVYTMLTHVFDASGQVVYILKDSGSKELSDDCRVFHVRATAELYAWWQDPLGDEAPQYGTVVFDDAGSATRLSVDPSCGGGGIRCSEAQAAR